MQLTSVVFERVFDLQQHTGNRYTPVHTLFSFESAGKKAYSVTVMGWPAIEAGMKITALLRERDNWQTLSGWKNHSNGKVVLPAFRQSRSSFFTAVGVTTISFYGNLLATTTVGSIAAFCVSLLLIGISISHLMQWRRKASEAQIILRLPDECPNLATTAL